MKHWRIAYGAVYACAATALIVALALNAPSIGAKAVREFDFGWAFWSASTMAPGVIFYVALWILLTLLERKFPAGAVKPASYWFLNLKMSLVIFILQPFFNVLLGVLLGYISTGIDVGLIDLHVTQDVSLGKGLTAFVIWFFAIDFFYYWYHRFMHESFLWQQHKVHHMDEHVGAITAYRVHWLDQLFYSVMVTAPTTLLFKFDPSTGGILLGFISLFTGLWETLFHTNVKLEFGRASLLFTSPQLHRIHHSRLPEHHDKNFAGYFPILDVMFGTYYQPRRGEYPPTGVHDDKDIRSFARLLFLPLHEWWKMLRDWRNRRGAISR